MKLFDSNNNQKDSISIEKNNLIEDKSKTFYFPSLTHKESLSLNDLKHQIYYLSRTKKLYNHFNNIHDYWCKEKYL